MRESRTIWDLGLLPFHIGARASPQDDRFPLRLPFRAGYDEELGLVTQVYDPGTERVLRRVYAHGTQLGVRMDDYGLGKAYAADFESVIRRWMGAGIGSSSVLEIGCGSGHLLGVLAEACAEVGGVEPDARCKAAMEERGIPVACCEFDDFRSARRWDCVLHYGVLEHVVDPVVFLRRQRELLAPGGRIICAVPDCAAAFEDGDMSIFVHQHWSYFSMASLRRLAAAAGLRVEAEERARVGALLYAGLVADGIVSSCGGGNASRTAAATARGTGGGQGSGGDHAGGGQGAGGDHAGGDQGAGGGQRGVQTDASGAAEALRFVERARRARSRLDAFVHGVDAAGRTLGIYCPERAINYVPEGRSPWLAARLFDDAPHLHGKYVPPFSLAVEAGDGLGRAGVDDLIIMSRAFGAEIEAAVRARDSEPAPRIRHIGDVLST